MQEKNIFFVIPARRDSKGFPFKNRKLLDLTISQIPNELHNKTIVSTNDEEIIHRLESTKINILKRDEKLSHDDVNIRDVMKDVIEKFNINQNDIIVMLYLTSPGRKFSDINKILEFYKEEKVDTLTCCVEPKTHPYLCLFKNGDGKGKQVIEHDMYRRQDYPECFEVRHFVCVFKAGIIEKLNKNMYNDDTYFYKIEHDVDVDYEYDLQEFLKK
tara:strand:- start:10371 stop:11015 length:645 start_codon:yes stop_codon:yes gene_type:complete